MLGYTSKQMEMLISKLYKAQSSLTKQKDIDAIQQAIDVIDGLLVEGRF